MRKYTLLLLLLLGLIHVEARLLDSWPRVVRNNSEVVFTLVLADEPILKEPEKLTLQYVQMDAVRANGKNYGRGYDKIAYKLEGNVLTTAPIRIVGETEHTVRLVTPGPSGKLGKDAVVIAHHHVYAVEPDFFRLKPYRVNFHAASKLLGEQQPASPAHYFATLRQRGNDIVFYSSPDLGAAQKAIQDIGERSRPVRAADAVEIDRIPRPVAEEANVLRHHLHPLRRKDPHIGAGGMVDVADGGTERGNRRRCRLTHRPEIQIRLDTELARQVINVFNRQPVPPGGISVHAVVVQPLAPEHQTTADTPPVRRPPTAKVTDVLNASLKFDPAGRLVLDDKRPHLGGRCRSRLSTRASGVFCLA